jgi:hypothetical protein
MDATACLICLEKFTEDEAFIPELECECAFFVHWHCWEQWCGACLYCRVYDEEQVEEPEVENVNQQIMQKQIDDQPNASASNSSFVGLEQDF